jgi:hypothetical protein
MFLGHVGVGLGAKSAAPRVSLGTLLLASLFLDLLWPTLLLLGFEHCEISPGDTKITPISFTDYPFSHSLLAVLFWACLFAGINYLIRRIPKEAWICGIIVFSHWVLDLLVHRADLQLLPGVAFRVGFGLWNYLPVTIAVELSIFIIGISLYCYNTRSVDRAGSIGFWGIIALLVIIYIGNIFGPPPPSIRAVAWLGQTQWLLVIWGFWIEKHRTLRWLYN